MRCRMTSVATHPISRAFGPVWAIVGLRLPPPWRHAVIALTRACFAGLFGWLAVREDRGHGLSVVVIGPPSPPSRSAEAVVS